MKTWMYISIVSLIIIGGILLVFKDKIFKKKDKPSDNGAGGSVTPISGSNTTSTGGSATPTSGGYVEKATGYWKATLNFLGKPTEKALNDAKRQMDSYMSKAKDVYYGNASKDAKTLQDANGFFDSEEDVAMVMKGKKRSQLKAISDVMKNKYGQTLSEYIIDIFSDVGDSSYLEEAVDTIKKSM